MRRPLRLTLRLCHYRGCALALLGLVGLFAFAVSAASPQDDDYQHDFIHARRTARLFAARTKTSSAKCTQHDENPLVLKVEPDFRTHRTVGRLSVLEPVRLERPSLQSPTSRAPPIT